jgi:hypothetical protein
MFSLFAFVSGNAETEPMYLVPLTLQDPHQAASALVGIPVSDCGASTYNNFYVIFMKAMKAH